jgi:branched-subunit amino acid aminotransferase/4-amino-4-deoxychorismate lyase
MTSAAANSGAAPWVMAEADAITEWVAAGFREPDEALRLRLQGKQLWALLEPLPEVPSPYRLRLMPHPHEIPSRHPLAPHKGLLGVWNAAPLNEAKAAGAHDALLYWPDGTLVETAIASIALEVDGDLWLPPLEGRVASLAERLDLPEWAGSRKLRIQAFSAGDLHRGRLWCFNAVRGIWPGTLL